MQIFVNCKIFYQELHSLQLDYVDILYDQSYNMSFQQKLDSIQYDACLAITGFIRGTLKEKSIIEWNNLDPDLRNSENFGIFKNNILKFIRLKPNSFFNCCYLNGIRLITRLQLELSHLCEHKFNYNFQNCLNPLCSCDLSTDSTSHFLLHCAIFHDERHSLLSILNNIDCKILESTDSYLKQTLLFGCTSFDSKTNALVLNATIDFILSTEIFEEPLFKKKNFVFHMQSFNPFRTSRCLFHLSVFLFLLFSTFFLFDLFVLPGTLDFQCLVIVIF